MDSLETVISCARFALDKKACDLEIFEIGPLTSVAEYFLVCSGRSDTQVQTIARHIRENLPVHVLAVEGMSRGQWVLLDYGDVVVHVFYPPVRRFYDLEGLWIKAPRIELPEPYLSQARSLVAETAG